MFRPRNKKQLRFQGVDVDTLSGEYENGSALHISATNLGLEAAKVLLTYGADPQVGWSNHYTVYSIHALWYLKVWSLRASTESPKK